jgi:hypothetical protein
MGIVRLGPNGEAEVINSCTQEEVARADAAVIAVAEALGRLAAQRDYANTTKAQVRDKIRKRPCATEFGTWWSQDMERRLKIGRECGG